VSILFADGEILLSLLAFFARLMQLLTVVVLETAQMCVGDRNEFVFSIPQYAPYADLMQSINRRSHLNFTFWRPP
jgi:hypothetical protein